jgi:hypothetical protein
MAATRFSGGDARVDFLPIRGWERSEILPLSNAVRELPIEDINDYAEDSVEFARHYLTTCEGDPHGLGLHEVASINLYTEENLGNEDQSFFRVLNMALNSRDRRQVVPFFPYIKLFVTAVRKLPNTCPLKIWRGFPTQQPDWTNIYPQGKEIYWWGFSSTTKSSDVLMSPAFFGVSGNRTLFMLDCISGVDVSPYSDYPEDEVLLSPGAKFIVEQVMPPNMLGGALQVVMRQQPCRHDMFNHTVAGGGIPSFGRGAMEPQPEVFIPAPASAVVRTFVHDLIDKGIQEHEIAYGMYYIDLHSKNITDLTAFRDCADKLRDLQVLGFGSNQISDVSPLATLVNLQKLFLHDNQISDVSPLATLVNLYHLDLDGNQISDVSPLATLVNLQRLDLRNNQINDVSPLATLVNLQVLDLQGNQGLDKAAVKRMFSNVHDLRI